jgi:hypothetical protein
MCSRQVLGTDAGACVAGWLLCLVSMVAALQLCSRALATPADEAPPPRYELALEFEEFSVLHSAVRSAVDHYGGEIGFAIAIRKKGGGLRWLVTLHDSRTMEAVRACASEMTTEVIRAADFEKLDPESAAALKVIQSLNNKIAHAVAHPIWDPATVTGLVREQGDHFVIETESGGLRVTGPRSGDMRALAGKNAIATGYRKVLGEIELDHVVEKGADPLKASPARTPRK